MTWLKPSQPILPRLGSQWGTCRSKNKHQVRPSVYVRTSACSRRGYCSRYATQIRPNPLLRKCRASPSLFCHESVSSDQDPTVYFFAVDLFCFTPVRLHWNISQFFLLNSAFSLKIFFSISSFILIFLSWCILIFIFLLRGVFSGK